MSDAYRRSRERDRCDAARSIRLTGCSPAGPAIDWTPKCLRDQALALSGLLVDRQGGPSVKPPQPDGLWAAVGYSGSNTVRFHRTTRRQGLPPQRLHVLETNQSAAANVDLRCAQSRIVHGATRTHQHAAASAAADERRRSTSRRPSILPSGPRGRPELEPRCRSEIDWLFETVTARLPRRSGVRRDGLTLLEDMTAYYSQATRSGDQACRHLRRRRSGLDDSCQHPVEPGRSDLEIVTSESFAPTIRSFTMH